MRLAGLILVRVSVSVVALVLATLVVYYLVAWGWDRLQDLHSGATILDPWTEANLPLPI